MIETEAGTIGQGAYDPELEPLDLAKDEKRRVTALMLAIKAWTDCIVKDGTMYQAMVNKGVNLKAADTDNIIDIAVKFDAFIATGTNLLRGPDEEASPTPSAEAAS